MTTASNETLTGGCLCGQARYELIGPPGDATICHCRTCQRSSGAESVGWVEFKTKQVTWSGDSRKRFASSSNVERTFCGNCGCSLSYQLKDDYIDLTVATLDNPEAIQPTKEIWLDHHISWNALNPEMQHKNQ